MIQVPVAPELTEYLYNKATARRLPLSVSFELTPVCNMACRMCYVRMDKQTQERIGRLHTAEEWLKLAEEGRENGLLFILLTGGEPFIHPEFREILSGLHKRGFIISVNTNGTLIDEETVSWLKETPPSRMNITLYGSSDASYERLCGKADGFTKVTRGIKLLKEAGIDVKINVSVTPYNKDDLDGIFEYCQKERLIIQANSYMFPPLRRDAGSIGRNDRLEPEEAAYCAARIECLLNGPEAYLKRADDGHLKELKLSAEEDCDPAEGEEGYGILCRAGRCTGWVTWEGKMLICGMIPDRTAANAFEQGYMPAWKQVVEKADAVRLPVKCRECSIKDTCKPCAAMVYTETGGFSEVPQYRCEMAHAYPVQALKLAEELRKQGG